MMGHQQDIPIFIPTLQLVHKATVTEEHMLAAAVDQGKLLRYHIAELGKFRIIVASLDRNRLSGDQLLKFRGI
jgi:hypothetical protein